MNARRAVSAWALVCGFMVAIFYVSSIPGDRITSGSVWGLDKVVHALEYALLAALVARALGIAPRLRPAPAACLATVLATAYGLSDEWHQSFVPGRTSTASDLAADALGSLVGAAVVSVRRAIKEGRDHENGSHSRLRRQDPQLR